MTDKKQCTRCTSSCDGSINLKNGEIYKMCVGCREMYNNRAKERRTEYLELYNEEIQMLKIITPIRKYEKKKDYVEKNKEENKVIKKEITDKHFVCECGGCWVNV